MTWFLGWVPYIVFPNSNPPDFRPQTKSNAGEFTRKARVFFGVGFLYFLAACQTGGEPTVRGATHVFEVAPERAFEASERALRERGFRIVEVNPAEQMMRAMSPIRREPGLQTASQREVTLFFREAPAGGTEMNLWISLIEENLFRFETPLATRVFLDRSPLYFLIFSDIQRELDNLLASAENE